MAVFNRGSSSIRFAVYQGGDTLRRRLDGKIDRIGMSGATFVGNDPDRPSQAPRPLAAADYGAAVQALLDWLEAQPIFAAVSAAGHRVVHGMHHLEPEPVTPVLLAELHRITPNAPDHLPGEIALIEALTRRQPQLPRWRVSTPPFTKPCRGSRSWCRFRGASTPAGSSATAFTVCRTPI